MHEDPDTRGVDFFPDWGHALPTWMGENTPKFSAQLEADLREWVRVWQVELDPVSEIKWPSKEMGRAWIAEGYRLVREVQELLGEGYVLKPAFTQYDPDYKD